MSDNQRKGNVDYIVMHHSTGSEFINSEDIEVQDWYDRVGKGRGYKGYTRSYHQHPSRNKETFSQAQYGLHAYSKDGNKYGWRLTPLMKDVWNNVAWHAGNWSVNVRSIGIETCGNYVNKQLPEKALMLVADTFRAQDIKLGGKLQVMIHRDFKNTACPGKIGDQRMMIVDMLNNPSKWNAKLFPVSAPKPTPKPTPTPKKPSEVELLKKHIKNLEKDTANKSVHITNVEKDLKVVTKKWKDCTAKLESFQKESKQLRIENKTLKVQNTDLSGKVKERDTIIEKLRTEKQDSSKTENKSSVTIANLKLENTALTKQKDAYKKQLELSQIHLKACEEQKPKLNLIDWLKKLFNK